jgi:hypothetical protein
MEDAAGELAGLPDGVEMRRVSPALPVTMLLKMSLLLGNKAYLMPATAIEINMKAAHILLNAMCY